MKKYKYKARYQSSNAVYRTNYYPTKEEAQDALMKKCGNFHYLGQVAGDAEEDGECNYAPRNNGSVSIEERLFPNLHAIPLTWGKIV